MVASLLLSVDRGHAFAFPRAYGPDVRPFTFEAQRGAVRSLRLGCADLALGAAALHLVDDRRRAAALDEIGAMQLAVLEVEPQAARIAQVTVAGGRHTRAARQRARIDAHHRALRFETADAVLAFAVGDQRGAVRHHHAHARDADLFRILHMVVVAVDEHLAEHASLGAEHTTGDAHAVAVLVGGNTARQRIEPAIDATRRYAARLGLRTVDAVAFLRADADANAVAQHQLARIAHAAEVERERRADAALRIGDRPVVHRRGACDVRETGGQAIDHRRLPRQGTRRHRHRDAVAHAVAEFDDRAVAGLVEQHGARQRGVERDVVVEDVRRGGTGRQRQVVGRRRADGSGRCVGLRLHIEERTRPARRRDRSRCRFDQLRDEAIARRRRDR